MQVTSFVTFLCVAVMAKSVLTEAQPAFCDSSTCKLPLCRCWNDESIPGGIAREETPQVVIVTFQYALNDGNVDNYLQLFEGVTNPNNCPAVGTFFVQTTDTDLGLIRALHESGHEIGATTIDGTTPQTDQQWKENLAEVRNVIISTGIPEADVVGFRAPEVHPGGFNQWLALSSEKYLYDASCITSQFDEAITYRWPYTYDTAPGPACNFGEGPALSFPGKWQFLIASLSLNETICATPAACTNVRTQGDAFDIFYNSFIQHYDGKRSPFVIIINPEWAISDFKREGTRQFLEYIRAAFPDTWIVSAKKALDWMQNPVPNVNATDVSYKPWAC